MARHQSPSVQAHRITVYELPPVIKVTTVHAQFLRGLILLHKIVCGAPKKARMPWLLSPP